MTTETMRKIELISKLEGISKGKVIDAAVSLYYEANEIYMYDTHDCMNDAELFECLVKSCKGSERLKTRVIKIFHKNGIRTRLEFITTPIGKLLSLEECGPRSKDLIRELMKKTSKVEAV